MRYTHPFFCLSVCLPVPCQLLTRKQNTYGTMFELSGAKQRDNNTGEVTYVRSNWHGSNF